MVYSSHVFRWNQSPSTLPCHAPFFPSRDTCTCASAWWFMESKSGTMAAEPQSSDLEKPSPRSYRLVPSRESFLLVVRSSLPSGYLLHSHGIDGTMTKMVYLLKTDGLSMAMLNNQMVTMVYQWWILPICSMYRIFTNIYHQNDPTVGKYSIHGASGLDTCQTYNLSLVNNCSVYFTIDSKRQKIKALKYLTKLDPFVAYIHEVINQLRTGGHES